jgi:predicted transcriptional regulator
MWSQVRRHLDVPLAEAIHGYQGSWASKLLTGFCLSAVGRRPPKWRIDNAAWVKARREGNLIDWVSLMAPTSRSTPKNRQKVSDADQVLDNVRAWDENLRFVIHSSDAPLPGNVSVSAHLRFCATLDTIRSLLDALHAFRPQIGRDPLKAHEGARPRLPDAVIRRQHDGYCELCWRHTMRTTGMADRDVPDIKARRLSDRFCSEHNPSDPSSRYRADQRYKQAFQRELMALQHNTAKSVFEVQFHPPRTADAQEIRKTAYDLVHARLRPLTRLEKPSLRESVWLLHQKGMRQADIARQIGTTRQSVSRAIRNTEKLLKTRQQEQMLNPSSGESWVKSEDSLFVQSVAAFHQDGYTAAQIARITGRFRHTVLAVLRWLAATSPPATNDVGTRH